MGILVQVARLILAEHKANPISGTVLLIARQTVYTTAEGAKKILEEEGVSLRPEHFIEIDQSTVQSSGVELITDRSFFSMFTDANVIALDVSDYEGAEIIHDLNVPIDNRHAEIADFIYNGSCLDNMFDPATAIKSMSKMLKKGGRLFCVEHGTQVQGAYIMFSAEWFFGFYAANNYQCCSIYLAHFVNHVLEDQELYRWKPFSAKSGKFVTSPNRIAAGDYLVFSIAQKSDDSTDDRTPIQGFYRMMQAASENQHYLERAYLYETSHSKLRLGLPSSTASDLAAKHLPLSGDHFEYIGTLWNKAY